MWRSPRGLNGSGRSRRLWWSAKVLHPPPHRACVCVRSLRAFVISSAAQARVACVICATAGDEHLELQQGVRVVLKDMITGVWNPGVIHQRRTEQCAAWPSARHPLCPGPRAHTRARAWSWQTHTHSRVRSVRLGRAAPQRRSAPPWSSRPWTASSFFLGQMARLPPHPISARRVFSLRRFECVPAHARMRAPG